MNERKLKAKLVEKGITVEEFAEILEMHPSTYYRKLRDWSFTVAEVRIIMKTLELSSDELNSIFFRENVA